MNINDYTEDLDRGWHPVSDNVALHVADDGHGEIIYVSSSGSRSVAEIDDLGRLQSAVTELTIALLECRGAI